jgi:hypothetical protein
MSKVVKFREDVETPRHRILNVSYFFAEVLGKHIVNPSPRSAQLHGLLTDKLETLIEGLDDFLRDKVANLQGLLDIRTFCELCQVLENTSRFFITLQ